jgi:hypothetical protein
VLNSNEPKTLCLCCSSKSEDEEFLALVILELNFTDDSKDSAKFFSFKELVNQFRE